MGTETKASPIFRPPPRKFRQARRAFEKECLRSLQAAIRGSGWKKKENSIFREADGFFMVAYLIVSQVDSRTLGSFRAKPMSLDPIFWEIMQMPENVEQPLSFRAWAAFKCSNVEFAETSFEDKDQKSQEVASAFLHWTNERTVATLRKLKRSRFSEIVKNHAKFKEYGAHSETLICSLIAENDYEDALRMARAYARGDLPSGLNFSATMGGSFRSFFDFAIDWLNRVRLVHSSD